jgi:hypothetical protein
VCRTISQVDLSEIDVHRKATLASLIPRLSCRRCQEAPQSGPATAGC